MITPEDILCTSTHEWILEENNIYSIGLTDFQVQQLGDIVFVELPEIGATFSKGEVFATIESVKAASEIYMPVSGSLATAGHLPTTTHINAGFFSILL